MRQDLVSTESRQSKLNPMVRKGDFAFRILGPSYADLMKPKLIEALIETSKREGDRSVLSFLC